MTNFLKENGISNVEPLHIGLWALPTAICALLIHLFRLSLLDAKISQEITDWQAKQKAVAL